MSTRAQIRFATREDGVSFSEHPDKIHAQFYCHSDGYPEGLGLDIAEMVSSCKHVGSWEIEELQTIHGDLEYIYYIWQAYDKSTWISIFNGYGDEFTDKWKCIFVGTTEKLIEKYCSQLDESYYKLNTNEDG